MLLPLIGLAWGVSLGLFLISGYHVGFRITDGGYLVPPNTPWYSPLGAVQLLDTFPTVRYAVWGVALLVSLFIGPLVRRVARPKGGRAALGAAAVVGLVGMQAAALIVGPFLATEDAKPAARPHALASVEDLTRQSADERNGSSDAVKRDVERLRTVQGVDDDAPPAGDRPEAADARLWMRAYKTNRVHEATVGMGVRAPCSAWWCSSG